jgi:hypothetical protein
MGECEQNLGFTFPKKYFSKLKYMQILNTPLSSAYYSSIMSIMDFTNIQVLEIHQARSVYLEKYVHKLKTALVSYMHKLRELRLGVSIP